MPFSREINLKFGVYVSECCGAEIVIVKGARFPSCPNHLNWPTNWKSTVDEPIREDTEPPLTKKRDTAA